MHLDDKKVTKTIWKANFNIRVNEHYASFTFFFVWGERVMGFMYGVYGFFIFFFLPFSLILPITVLHLTFFEGGAQFFIALIQILYLFYLVRSNNWPKKLKQEKVVEWQKVLKRKKEKCNFLEECLFNNRFFLMSFTGSQFFMPRTPKKCLYMSLLPLQIPNLRTIKLI